MKCQKCNQPAELHVTEILDGKPVEIHLCREHAKEYFSQTHESIPGNQNVAAALASHIAQQMAFSKVSSECSETDMETCPSCGNTYYEFRMLSGFGCPDDYRVFGKQLETILMNIHGELRHVGKAPIHFGEPQSRRCTGLIRLRRDLAQLVTDEKYEEATILRDKIKQLEKEAGIE